jgi:hypothetical protein
VSNLAWSKYDPKVDAMATTNSWPRWVCRDAGAIVGFIDQPNGVHWEAYTVSGAWAGAATWGVHAMEMVENSLRASQ